MAGHHKPRDLITYEIPDNNTTQPQRLKYLITAAQNGDKAALLQLCEDFAPLLRSEARREMFLKRWAKMLKALRR